MSTTIGGIPIIAMPDLGAVNDTSSFVGERAGSGRFAATALRGYVATGLVAEAPADGTAYGRLNGTWTPVLAEAPSTGDAYGRLNGAWSPVLPLNGDSTVSGNVSVTGDILSGSRVFANELEVGWAAGFEVAVFHRYHLRKPHSAAPSRLV